MTKVNSITKIYNDEIKSPQSQLAFEFDNLGNEFPTCQDVEPTLENYLLSELAMLDLPEDEPAAETDISQKWRYSSAMQKSIRRGYVNDAIRYALTFHALDPTGFWTRLVVIAFEDIGVGGQQELALTMIAAKSKVWRRKAGGDEKVIHYIVKALTESVKDRLCCDYMIAMMHCPRRPKIFNMLRTASLQELTEIALSEKYSSSIRASAAWLLWGTDKLENNQLPFRQGSREAFTAMIEQMEVPALVKYITLRGMIACRYPMNIVYPFLWLRMNKSLYYCVQTTSFPDKRHYVGGLPEEAFDQHSREGKSCLAYFAKSCAPVDQWLTSRGILERDRRIAAVGVAVFILEGAKLDKRLEFEGANEIYETTERIDYQNVGLSLEDGRFLAKMVDDNYETLRQSRIRVVTGR